MSGPDAYCPREHGNESSGSIKVGGEGGLLNYLYDK
jgi:hypothetical protein